MTWKNAGEHRDFQRAFPRRKSTKEQIQDCQDRQIIPEHSSCFTCLAINQCPLVEAESAKTLPTFKSIARGYKIENIPEADDTSDIPNDPEWENISSEEEVPDDPAEEGIEDDKETET